MHRGREEQLFYRPECIQWLSEEQLRGQGGTGPNQSKRVYHLPNEEETVWIGKIIMNEKINNGTNGAKVLMDQTLFC